MESDQNAQNHIPEALKMGVFLELWAGRNASVSDLCPAVSCQPCQLMINFLDNERKIKSYLHAVYKSIFIYVHFVVTNDDLSYIETCFTG